MNKRSFYVALGIPRGVNPDTIQPAYRRLVTRYRRELQQMEAEEEPTLPPVKFEVLRTYSERRHVALLGRPDPEPLIPTGADATEVDRFYGGYVPEALEPARARREGKDLFVELRLGGDDAERGGLFPVHIPVMRHCPSCTDGADEQDRLSCAHCGGSGRVLEDRMVEVATPPGVRNGDTARLAMEDVGLSATDLIIRILI